MLTPLLRHSLTLRRFITQGAHQGILDQQEFDWSAVEEHERPAPPSPLHDFIRDNCSLVLSYT